MIADFGKHYGITFRNAALLKLALTHRSYLHVTGQGPRDSNERLEFLGDSVLGLVTSEYLYRAHPTEHEGQLTKTKSLLVSKAILSRRALAMGLGRFVFMSHSEVESGGRQRLSILADAFEAVVGAIYLDQGFEAARDFIEHWLLRESRVIVADKRHTNYKSHLQEYVQSAFRTHPVYRIRSELGPDHSKQFMVEVIVGRRVLGSGKGRNKKEAEQAAARHALEQVGDRSGDRGTEREPRRSDRESVGGARGALREPRREDREPEAATVRTEPAPDATDPGAPVDGARRRRGRRGGRGRRREEPGTSDAARATPPPPRDEAPAGREPGTSPRPAPRESQHGRGARAERVEPRPAHRVELEPPPRTFEEDEYEEVGRPEGPLEERHVDPFAWGALETPVPGSRNASELPQDAKPRGQETWEEADRAVGSETVETEIEVSTPEITLKDRVVEAEEAPRVQPGLLGADEDAEVNEELEAEAAPRSVPPPARAFGRRPGRGRRPGGR
jgi:ribonuclease-3